MIFIFALIFIQILFRLGNDALLNQPLCYHIFMFYYHIRVIIYSFCHHFRRRSSRDMNADFRVEFANHVTISSFGYIQMALVDYKYYFHAVGMGILYKILEVYSTLMSLIWIFRSSVYTVSGFLAHQFLPVDEKHIVFLQSPKAKIFYRQQSTMLTRREVDIKLMLALHGEVVGECDPYISHISIPIWLFCHLANHLLSHISLTASCRSFQNNRNLAISMSP